MYELLVAEWVEICQRRRRTAPKRLQGKLNRLKLLRYSLTIIVKLKQGGHSCMRGVCTWLRVK